MGLVFFETNGFVGIAGLSLSFDNPGGGHTRLTFTGLFSVFGFGKRDFELGPFVFSTDGKESFLEGSFFTILSVSEVFLKGVLSLLTMEEDFSANAMRLLLTFDSEDSLVIFFGDLTPASCCTFR